MTVQNNDNKMYLVEWTHQMNNNSDVEQEEENRNAV